MLLLAVRGSLLGYLRFNVHPAKIFMGDTGSLAIGGLLAASAMILKQELLLVVIAGVFVMELLSVVIQVTSYKATKRVGVSDGTAASSFRAGRYEGNTGGARCSGASVSSLRHLAYGWG